jgi:hypothetical protein
MGNFTLADASRRSVYDGEQYGPRLRLLATPKM